MNSQLLQTEFTVTDHIKVDHKWTEEYPDWEGSGDGHLLILSPKCPGDSDLADITAVAITPAGKQLPLAFDKIIVNTAGCVSLFFEGIFTKTAPVGSKVRFAKSEADPAGDDSHYIAQVRLDVPEADRILPRLEKEGIRFQIDTDLETHPSGKTGFRDGRIALFIHVDDLPAWEKIREDYFPT